MTVLRTTVGVLIVLVVGCGGASSPAEKTFGQVSEQDATATKKVIADVRRYSSNYTDFVAAINADAEVDVERARAAADGLQDAVNAAQSEAVAIDNTDLNATLSDYLSKLQRVAGVVERVVSYYEAPGEADYALEDQLASDLLDAASPAQQADRAFIRRVSKHLPPDQRDRLQKQCREAMQDFTEEVGD